MTAGPALPFTLRGILDRVGLALTQQRGGRGSGMRVNRWRRMFAALEDWLITPYLAWRSEILSRDHAERFHRFCRDCGEDTSHEGFDQFGAGWYAQIFRCRYCGGQDVRVWPFAWG